MADGAENTGKDYCNVLHLSLEYLKSD